MYKSSRFEWDDRYLLGHSKMDDTHREFVALVNELLTVDDSDLPKALARFSSHAEAHFAQEKMLMESDYFPARDCHVDEHNKVLDSVRNVQKQLAAGDVDLCRDLALALMEWFPRHADYMDSALATWLIKRAYGGSPLVLKRFQ